ncbi:caspase family protein [Myxococcota bacterium]|nr:caspase family protein [Myxococcota bacterium]
MNAALLALALLGATAGEEARPPAIFALIVGVNDSPSADLEPLRYADDDAARYTDLFKAIGATTFTLMRPDADTRGLHRGASAEAAPPTRAQLEAQLKALRAAVAAAKAAEAVVDIFFIYSGHGVAYNGQGALTLEGGAMLDGVALHKLLVADTPADHIHIILDACNSHLFERFGARGPGGRRHRVTPGFSMLAPLSRAPRVGLLLSTRDTRAVESYEWDRFQAGVFSHLLRSGLSGGADVNGDGRISYWEIGAFIERAGVGVLNPRFRPKVHARAPANSPVLLSLRPAVDARHIEVVGGGHRYLEDRDGVRLLDVHPHEGVRLRVLRPSGRDPLYLRQADERQEWALPTAPIVKVAQLRPRAPEISRKGAAHLAFDQLFSAPFSGAEVQDWRRASLTQTWAPEAARYALSASATGQSGFTEGGGALMGGRLTLERGQGDARWGASLGYSQGQYRHEALDVTLQQAELGLGGVYLLSDGPLTPTLGLEIAFAHAWQEGRPLEPAPTQRQRAYLGRYRARLGLEWSGGGAPRLGLSALAGHALFPAADQARVAGELGLEISAAYLF